MESRYDKARYNKTYYEKNKEKLRELQRQKRRKWRRLYKRWRRRNKKPKLGIKNLPKVSPIFSNISDTTKSMLFKAAVSGSLVASQAAYRAFKKTIENRQSSTPTPSVSSFNPLD